MRRVVVTGMGLVTPLACGVEATWQRVSGKSGLGRSRLRRLPSASRIAGQIPRGDGTDGTTIPISGWSRKSSARSTISSSYGLARRPRRSRMPTGSRKHGGPGRDRRLARVQHRRLTGIAETGILLKEKGTAPCFAVLHPRRLINLASGYVSNHAQAAGTEHAVVTACSTGVARDWRCWPPGRARRCRGHGGGRLRISDQPHFMWFAASRALSTAFNDDPTRASWLTRKTAMVSCWPRALA